MSRINGKMGLRPAGARARLRSLSGVDCPQCRAHYVISTAIHGALLWTCGVCAHSWRPALVDIQRYNGRVRFQDRLTVPQ